MHRIHDKLHLMCLTAEQRSRTCDYWYTIVSNNTPFTAFRSRAALERFLARHKITFDGTLPAETGTHATFALQGDARFRMVGSRDELPKGQKVLTLSNGDYTTGILVDIDGHPVVHFVGPNGNRDRIDPQLARRTVDEGRDYPTLV